MLNLDNKQIEKIENYISYIETIYDKDEVNEIVSQIFITLMSERQLCKNCLCNEAEKFLYTSGINKELQIKRNRQERNKRYQENRKEGK